jgi:hypothetical protein
VGKISDQTLDTTPDPSDEIILRRAGANFKTSLQNATDATGTEVNALPAADETEAWWLVPVEEDGELVQIRSDTLTRSARVQAPSDRSVGYEEFFAVPTTANVTDQAQIGSTPFFLSSSGTPAGVAQSAATTFLPGSLTLTTGTSTTGIAGAGLTWGSILFVQGETYKVSIRAQIPTVTTTGQTFDTYIGLRSSFGTNAVNDGIYFHAKSGTSAGNWFAVTEDDTITTATDIDTGTAVDTAVHVFTIIHNGTDAKFYIDEVLEATISANRPDTFAALTVGANICKTAGSTARTLILDWAQWDLFTGSRGNAMGQFSL